MSIETIRLSKSARDQLITLKRHTGIENWNILCRWAFCLSLAEETVPRADKIPADSPVEMTWSTFAGGNDELYLALLKHRCIKDKVEITEDNLNQHFRRHLHRGIAYLAGNPKLKSLAGLLELTTDNVQ